MIYNTNYGIAAGLINCWIIGDNYEYKKRKKMY